ncbi:NAD(P)H-dependent glycerol-3-phosphate dehydrogenase [Lentisalinibacter sediminis]|uniref:NAD(P)H-dependent glycerol-3-phosphate dehydrogenase n=1 Tax=Lentisalinibacter sediminis TaxID=2992237 RepID=UPI0038671025
MTRGGAASSPAPASAGPVAVIGAGSWGTALAIQYARTGRETRMWGRETEEVSEMRELGENRGYLPGARFPEALHPEPDLAAALEGVTDVLIVVPSHGLRETLVKVRDAARLPLRVSWATKGFELETGKLPHEVAREVLGEVVPVAVLSGPTFAKEVGAGLPTALTVASPDADFAREIAESISTDNFRAYTSADMIGVEVGGAVKNVLAIGAGLSDGLGFGANTRIALITRGLIEMTRLGVAVGAERDTFMGLAGMGDLVLTCTDNQSRNRRMGLALAAGKTVAEAEAEIRQVVEGVLAARAVWEKAQALGVEMPIAEQIYRIIYERKSPQEAVTDLMRRALKPESVI